MAFLPHDLSSWVCTIIVAGIALVVVSIPTVVAFLLYIFLARIRLRYLGTIILTIAPFYTAYEIYTAIYPLDSFYYEEYKTVTQRIIPSSAVIVRKTAEYPDFHGDYASASIISLSPADYRILLDELSRDKRFIVEAEPKGSRPLDEVLTPERMNPIQKGFIRSIQDRNDHYYYIGFLNDGYSIVVYVSIT